MADLDIDLWDNAMRFTLEERLTRLALELLALGQSVVLEYGFWGRSERDRKRAEARANGVPVPVDLYYLSVPLEELWERVLTRNQSGSPDTVAISRTQLEEWAAMFQAPDAAELALFDRGAMMSDARTFPV
jgi:predicted kinase